MIQQRQGLNFKIIVSLIRIHAFAVKLFRDRYEIWAIYYDFVTASYAVSGMKMVKFLSDNDFASLPCIVHHFLYLEDFSQAMLPAALY